MKRCARTQFRRAAYTLVETMMAVGVSGLVLSGLMAGSVALQRSFAATVDFATAQNDQMRISDYLSVDMRRATTVTPDNSGEVTMTIPNYYKSDGTINPATVTSTMGWPSQKKKKKKNKHSNIIVGQTATYDSGNTTTVKYYKGSASAVGKDTTKFYRESAGVAKAIANDVADFNVTLNSSGDYATTTIKFSPRFRLKATSGGVTGTQFTQTTLLRNSD